MENNSNIETQTGRYDNRGGRVGAGLVFIVIGSLFLAHQMGADIPHWLFSWPMILIGIGLFAGSRHNFRPGGWMVMLVIGGIFLADKALDDVLDFRHFFWPIVIIAIGVVMILRPRGRRRRNWDGSGITSDEDVLDSTAIFSGTKKKIISKDFRGGDITAIFGGHEMDFTQADMTTAAEIDVTVIFGGAKLVVPANWNIKSDVVCIFGGIDDKRHIDKGLPDTGKTLILHGTVICGGIDIKSY